MFIWVTIVFLSTLPSAETAPVKAIEGPAACYLPAGESDLADLVAVAYEGLTGRVPQNVKIVQHKKLKRKCIFFTFFTRKLINAQMV